MKHLLVVIAVVNIIAIQPITAMDAQSDTTGNNQVYISKINIIGNKTTKKWIILRELSFTVGDSLTKYDLANRFVTSTQNLTNISLFNTIDMRYVMNGETNAEVFIVVTERWYLWPRPVFELAETNFNSWLENKDFSRINYGIEFIKNNFRGRNERLKLILQFGFTEMLYLSYSIPYINKKRTLGLGIMASYGQNHEINYLSFENKRLFYKDVDRVQQQHFRTGITFRYRKKFYSNHMAGVDYSQIAITDSVVYRNPEYLPDSADNLQYLTLSYKYVLDKRDNKNYPLTGSYLSAAVSKFGLGVLDPQVDLWWNKVEYKYYFRLLRKTYVAALARSHFYWNDFQPYYFRDGLGYVDKSTIRSYELYVIDAQQVGIAKLQVRYQLLAPKPQNLSFVPVNKFKKIHYSLYLGIFGDMGYANDRFGFPANDLANEMQYGYGVSLDLATYYDLVFRAEYSINKFGEHGLFLHFVAPI